MALAAVVQDEAARARNKEPGGIRDGPQQSYEIERDAIAGSKGAYVGSPVLQPPLRVHPRPPSPTN